MDFKIDPEIQALLTPLSSDEFDQLERNILDGLHVDPLAVFKIGSEFILGDGHNRRVICLKHGIDITTRVKEMSSREAAIQWVIDNQLGRRNLTDERKAYYRGKEYLNTKKAHGDLKRLESPMDSPSPQNEDLGGRTAKIIADKHRVSKATIERDAEFAAAIDALEPPVKEAVLSGTSGLTKKAIADGAISLFCTRCTRVGPVKDCPQCAELKATQGRPKKKLPKKKKPGQEKFDWREFDKHLGKVVRGLDDLVSAFKEEKETAEHAEALKHLGAFTKVWKKWQKRLCREEK